MLKLTLPLPPRGCSPNKTRPGAWREKQAASKLYRTEAWAATRNRLFEARLLDLIGQPLTIALTFCVKGSRGTGRYAPRDHDNATASFKAAQDGICDALGVPDSHKWLSSAGVTIDTTQGPYVLVRIGVSE